MSRVSKLMTDHSWNLPIDAKAILRIPLRAQEEDRWAWEPGKHGDFTMKSAYKNLAASQPSQASASRDDTWQPI